jgi:glyoxylase-like metal-dependent hydrolase (beta-lactamase superfamily II)
LLILAALSACASARADGGAVVRVQSMGSGISVLAGAGGNALYAQQGECSVLVDTQPAAQAIELLARIREIGPPPSLVIDTHAHSDKVGAHAALVDLGASIIAQQAAFERQRANKMVHGFSASAMMLDTRDVPQVRFDQRLELFCAGDDILLLHVPNAHTDGDVLVKFARANVLHTGDIFLAEQYPRIDGATGGSIDGLVAAVDAALRLTDSQTRVVPGRGPVVDAAVLRAYRNMLHAVRDTVTRAKRRRMSLDEVLLTKPTASFDARYGGGEVGPDQFIAAVYATVKPAR